MSFDFTGGMQMLVNLDVLTNRFYADVAREAKAALEDGLRVTNQQTPVRTGYLRSRNRARIKGWQFGGTWVAELSNDAKYAVWVELGTRRMRAQPFFLPGIQAAANSFLRRGARLSF